MKKYFTYITCGSVAEAKSIAAKIVEERLAACANILPGMISAYWWDGEVQNDEEVVMIVKTTEARFEALKQRVLELHSYDCPCIVALPIEKGHGEYLDWVDQETQGK